MINNISRHLTIEGVPGDAVAQAQFNAWIDKGVQKLLNRVGSQQLNISISNVEQTGPNSGQTKGGQSGGKDADELSTEQRAAQYVSVQPLFRLKQLIVATEMLAEIQSAIDAIRVEALVGL